MKKIALGFLSLLSLSATSYSIDPSTAYWTDFGLNCGAMALGTGAALANAASANSSRMGATCTASSTPTGPDTGSVVVCQPSVVYAQPAPAAQQQAVQQNPSPSQPAYARLQNADGSIKVVPLTPSGSGWLGPQGEFYPAYPSEDQLRARYP